MALTTGLQLPYGIQPVNPIAVDAWSGPYEGIDAPTAIASANASIPAGVRFKSLEVRLIINGEAQKYWYKDGTADNNLVPFDVDRYATVSTVLETTSANWDSVYSTMQIISAGQYAPIRKFDLQDNGFTSYSGIALYGTLDVDPGWKVTRLKTTLSGLVSSNQVAENIAWVDRVTTLAYI